MTPATRQKRAGLYVRSWKVTPATRHIVLAGHETLCGKDASWWEREADLERVDLAPKVCGSCLRVAASRGMELVEGGGS